MDTKDQEAIASASAPRNDIRIVTLDEPIQRGETMITEITLRRPYGPALRGISLSKLLNDAEYDVFEKLIPRISEPRIAPEDIASGNLCPSDLLQIIGEITNFFIPKEARDTISQTA